jgi:hypothetical protein
MSPDAGATNSFPNTGNKNPRCKLGIFPKKITLESSFGSMLYRDRYAMPSPRAQQQ